MPSSCRPCRGEKAQYVHYHGLRPSTRYRSLRAPPVATSCDPSGVKKHPLIRRRSEPIPLLIRIRRPDKQQDQADGEQPADEQRRHGVGEQEEQYRNSHHAQGEGVTNPPW